MLTISDAIKGTKYFRGWDLEIEAIEAVVAERDDLRRQLSEANAIIVKSQRLLELHVCDAPEDIKDYSEVMEYEAETKGGER